MKGMIKNAIIIVDDKVVEWSMCDTSTYLFHDDGAYRFASLMAVGCRKSSHRQKVPCCASSSPILASHRR